MNDYVGMASNIGNFSYTNQFSISAWIKSNLGGTQQIIYGNTWDKPGYQIRVTNANKIRFILVQSGSVYNGYDSGVIGPGWGLRSRKCGLALERQKFILMERTIHRQL